MPAARVPGALYRYERTYTRRKNTLLASLATRSYFFDEMKSNRDLSSSGISSDDEGVSDDFLLQSIEDVVLDDSHR